MQSFNQGLSLPERSQELREIAALIASRRLDAALAALEDPGVELAHYERKLIQALVSLLRRDRDGALENLTPLSIPDGDLDAQLLAARCLVMARRPDLALKHFTAAQTM